MMFDRATVSRVIIGVLAVAALTYGWMTSYPDNVNLSYGVPLRWGTHQLITIAGPVDTWRVDVSALLIDLLVWVALLIVVPMFVETQGRLECAELRTTHRDQMRS